MYIYIYMYRYMYIYIYMYVYIYTYIHEYIYIHTYIHEYTCISVCMTNQNTFLSIHVHCLYFLSYFHQCCWSCMCLYDFAPKKNQQPQEIQKNFACGKILLALSGWKPLNTLTWKDPTIKWWQFWWENLWKVCTLWWFDIVTYKMAHV